MGDREQVVTEPGIVRDLLHGDGRPGVCLHVLDDAGTGGHEAPAPEVALAADRLHQPALGLVELGRLDRALTNPQVSGAAGASAGSRGPCRWCRPRRGSFRARKPLRGGSAAPPPPGEAGPPGPPRKRPPPPASAPRGTV